MVGKKNRIVQIIKFLVLVFCVTVFVLPMWLTVTSSFEDSLEFSKKGYSLYISRFSILAYKRIFEDTLFWSSFLNSVWVTAATVVLSVTVNTLTAYVLHEKDLPFCRTLNFLFVFTMFFSAGMIPTYLIVKSLRLTDTFLALILPPALGVYNILLIRNYLYSLPKSMEEAALVDGANYLQVLLQVIIPVSKPIIVTTALITLIGKWNSWMDVLLYISKTGDHAKSMWTVQYYIHTLLNAVGGGNVAADGSSLQSQQVLSAAIVITVLPVMLLFPTLQKYFANGITLGSVKG